MEKGSEIAEFVKGGNSLKDAIGFQEHSVVSRMVISNKGGSVTLFSFDEGEGLSEHTAPFDALVYLIEGSAEITIDGNPHTVRKGEFIIMPAGRPHALSAITRFKMMLVMVREV